MNREEFEQRTDEELVQLRNEASNAYYGDGSTEPLLEDKEFDILVELLRERGVESPVGHGYVPDDSREKIAYEIPMLSLRKVKTGQELSDWLGRIASKHGNSVTYLAQPKYDGLAVSLMYYDGRLQSASKRGNGHYGDDVTPAIRFVRSIPERIDVPGQVEIRGEVIIKFDDFNRISEEYGYENIRNAASGILNRADGRGANSLTFIAYNMIRGGCYQDNEILELSSRHFVTPMDWGQFPCTYSEIPRAIYAIRQHEIQGKYPFEIDGAVIKVMEPRLRESLGLSSAHPNWAVAYKYPDSDVVTVFQDVEWSVGGTGRIVPVAIVKPVTIDGTIVNRANLHNINVLEELDIRLLDRIRVRKGNKVIPDIVGLTTEGHDPNSQLVVHPSMCPNCSAPTVVVENEGSGKKDLFCSNARNINRSCSVEQMIVRAIWSFGGERVKDSFVEKVTSYYPHVRSFLDLLDMKEDDFIQLSGVQHKMASNAVQEIGKAWNEPVCNWINAMGIPGIANSSADKLDEYIGTLPDILAAEWDQLVVIPGFGASKIESVMRGKPIIQEWMDQLQSRYNWLPQPWGQENWDRHYNRNVVVQTQSFEEGEAPQTVENQRWAGKRVVVTGSFLPERNREDIVQWLWSQGVINVGKNITKNTDVVIMGNDPSEHKHNTAHEMAATGSLELIERDAFLEEMNAE